MTMNYKKTSFILMAFITIAVVSLGVKGFGQQSKSSDKTSKEVATQEAAPDNQKNGNPYKDHPLLRKMYEQLQEDKKDPFLSSLRDFPVFDHPPDYDAVLKEAKSWSDEELNFRIAILIERFRE